MEYLKGKPLKMKSLMSNVYNYFEISTMLKPNYDGNIHSFHFISY